MKTLLSILLLSIISLTACSGSGSGRSGKVVTVADVGGNPDGVTVSDGGNIYITDIESGEIKQVDPDGTVTVIATTDTVTPDHPDGITAVTTDAGKDILYVTSTGTSDPEGGTLSTDGTIKRIDVDTGTVTTIVDSTVINTPTGIAADDSGNLYVADQANGTVYQIPVDENGNTGTPVDITASLPADVDIENPHGLALVTNDDDSVTIYITDQGDNSNNIVKIDIPDPETPAVNEITEVTPDSAGGIVTDTTTDNAQFNKPHGISVDKNGAIFVSDENNNRVQIITPNGNVITFAGNGTSGDTDGDPEDAQFNKPRGIAVDTEGNVLVCDYGNGKVKKISK